VAFSQSVILEDQEFPSVDSMMDYFMGSLLWAVFSHIPRSSTRPHYMPVTWWTDDCCNTVHS
jgi:hypothetical protein